MSARASEKGARQNTIDTLKKGVCVKVTVYIKELKAVLPMALILFHSIYWGHSKECKQSKVDFFLFGFLCFCELIAGVCMHWPQLNCFFEPETDECCGAVTKKSWTRFTWRAVFYPILSVASYVAYAFLVGPPLTCESFSEPSLWTAAIVLGLDVAVSALTARLKIALSMRRAGRQADEKRLSANDKRRTRASAQLLANEA
eukprot:gnl/Spiro4/8745_TR4586_c0_g1_i1.p1 gnl/Spiro4/8745_TR4586_c0_g1~~gnl/Spiro4/8745_TR4586_c0_g1_i1.p1  ORF type:complete len:215 (+),score=39.43 gnl/Spiro4/8745_TR4586_c0_g1_i1:44-646(+)